MERSSERVKQKQRADEKRLSQLNSITQVELPALYTPPPIPLPALAPTQTCLQRPLCDFRLKVYFYMWVTDGNLDARTGSQYPQNTGNGPGGTEDGGDG